MNISRPSPRSHLSSFLMFICIVGIALIFSVVNSSLTNTRTKAFKPNSPISGTFLSFPFAKSRNFTDTDWQKQFDVMNNIGIDTLIIGGILTKGYEQEAPIAYYRSTKYSTQATPAKPHLDTILDLATKYKMKVYIAPVDRSENWVHVDEHISLSLSVAQELYDKGYTTHPQFSGWYLQQEPFLNQDYTDYSSWKKLTETFKRLANKPVIISPYFIAPCNGDKTKLRCENQWWQDRTSEEIAIRAQRVMQGTEADIMAVQDGVGASGVSLQELTDYIPRIEQKLKEIGKEFWVDAEIFRYDTTRTKFIPASINDLVNQLFTLKNYKIVVWIFEHYMGPYFSNESHKLYADYITQYKLGTPPPPPFEQSLFADVSISAWTYPYIKILYTRGITSGCSKNPLKYCPETAPSRADAAILILRSLYGGTYAPPEPTKQRFTDVPSTHYAYKWIDLLAQSGITAGCGSGKFCPTDKMTRAQAAVMLIRAKNGGNFTPKFSPVFTDVPSSHWAAPWISELYKQGYTKGCGNGQFCPERQLTRAEMAVFLVNVFKLK